MLNFMYFTRINDIYQSMVSTRLRTHPVFGLECTHTDIHALAK